MYSQQRYILMTLDPVHVGTGGYRLGRVDLSIAREPGTNLPKIPGTTLAGAARSYAATRYGTLRCAGQGQGDERRGRQGHCADARCPVCYTFGYLADAEGGSAGRVSIADAQLLLFPVHSLAGPVWLSTCDRLAEAGFQLAGPQPSDEEVAVSLSGRQDGRPFNVGWLLLRSRGGVEVSAPASLEWRPEQGQAWEAVRGRVALVTTRVFGHVVNSNLEVRTSVSIDPQIGAAKKEALFTYEALPRATWLWCDVVEDDYRPGAFPADQAKARGLDHTRPLDVVKAGLDLAEYLGVGGMGTRGFGRIRWMAKGVISRA